jgi:hypothetical protein
MHSNGLAPENVEVPMAEEGARSERASRTRSPWNLFYSLLCLAFAGVIWMAIALLFSGLRRHFIATDAFLSNGTRIGDILMYVAPFFPALAISFNLGNLLAWSLASAKAAPRRFEPIARHLRFRADQIVLIKLGISLCVIALPLALLGASNFWAVSADRIDYRPMFAFATRHYAWSSVTAIQTGCYSGKSDTFNFALVMDDGTRLDLMEESPHNFAVAYPQVQLALVGHNFTFDDSKFVGACVGRAPQRWREILSQPPTK